MQVFNSGFLALNEHPLLSRYLVYIILYSLRQSHYLVISQLGLVGATLPVWFSTPFAWVVVYQLKLNNATLHRDLVAFKTWCFSARNWHQDNTSSPPDCQASESTPEFADFKKLAFEVLTRYKGGATIGIHDNLTCFTLPERITKDLSRNPKSIEWPVKTEEPYYMKGGGCL